jgi:hypothetical protein
MKLAVIGSRTLKGSKVKAVIEHVIAKAKNEIKEIVTGGANGVDAQAEAFAKAKGLCCTVFLPDYEAHGKRAPLIRNLKIVEECDALLAIWDGKSKGTAHTIRAAKRAGKPVLILRLEADRAYCGNFGETRGRPPKHKSVRSRVA